MGELCWIWGFFYSGLGDVVGVVVCYLWCFVGFI